MTDITANQSAELKPARFTIGYAGKMVTLLGSVAIWFLFAWIAYLGWRLGELALQWAMT